MSRDTDSRNDVFTAEDLFVFCDSLGRQAIEKWRQKNEILVSVDHQLDYRIAKRTIDISCFRSVSSFIVRNSR